MNEQLKKYLKTFRQSLRGMGLEVLPPKCDGMIIARNKADRLFDEYVVYDFRKEQPDGTVSLRPFFVIRLKGMMKSSFKSFSTFTFSSSFSVMSSARERATIF